MNYIKLNTISVMARKHNVPTWASIVKENSSPHGTMDPVRPTVRCQCNHIGPPIAPLSAKHSCPFPKELYDCLRKTTQDDYDKRGAELFKQNNGHCCNPLGKSLTPKHSITTYCDCCHEVIGRGKVMYGCSTHFHLCRACNSKNPYEMKLIFDEWNDRKCDEIACDYEFNLHATSGRIEELENPSSFMSTWLIEQHGPVEGEKQRLVELTKWKSGINTYF